MPARVEIIIQNEESKWQHVAHHAGLKIILYLSRILTPGREGAGQEDPMFVLGLVPLDLENFVLPELHNIVLIVLSLASKY